MSNFEEQIKDLDLKLFEKIKSQSDDEDKQSLLACQLAVRELHPNYNYLEIGSYLGGSIQPYLLDDKCAKIYSIDKRPLIQPDERGVNYVYRNNSTARMLGLLEEVSPEKIDKITTIDGDTRSLNPAQIPYQVHICFIDGEHTDAAVVSDFKFCLNLLNNGGGGLILFHDAEITYNGIAECINYLKENSIKFHAYNLPMVVFAIEINDFPIHQNPAIMERLVNNPGYLFSLQFNDYYRKFTNKLPFRLYRRLLTKWRGNNISE